jgi:hypothetical protein
MLQLQEKKSKPGRTAFITFIDYVKTDLLKSDILCNTMKIIVIQLTT